MPESDPKTLVESYLSFLAAGDVAQCVSCFTDDALIQYAAGTYSGRAAIEQWHRDRFEAGLELTSLDTMDVDGDTVVLQAAVTSRRLRSFRINHLKGTATFVVDGDKIKEAKLAPRRGFADHLGWLFRS